MISKISAAALLAVIAFAPLPAQASGTAPWCAVVNMGTGDAYWDCQYATFEACYPNILSGNRGFCNHNPGYEGPAPVSRKARKRAPQ
jgi:hypothetical protein